MLRHISLKNITVFKELQRFDFDNGVYFFIGPNDSGKSTVFEAIRRCVSSSASTSFSRSFDNSKPAIVLCVYDIEDNPFPSWNLLTGVVTLPAEEDGNGKNIIYIKFVYTSNNEIGIDLTRESPEEDTGIINQELEVNDDEECKRVFNNIKTKNFKIDEDVVNKIVNKLCDLAKTEKSRFAKDKHIGRNDNTTCNQTLRKFLDKKVVSTFQNRSLGSMQWSQSKKMHKAFKSTNYANATEKAEILEYYLNNVKEDTNEYKQIKDYFDTMTLNSGYVFQKINGEIFAERQGPKFRLLKVPEGIIEAKNISVLLGLNQFQTVCLEDPERGMHPQMVTRLRDLVLRQIEKKVVIIATHHQSFITSWMLGRTYLFRKKPTKTELFSEIVSGKEITKTCENARKKTAIRNKKEFQVQPESADNKYTRILTTSELSTLFFARCVLFVEGLSDLVFVTAVIGKLLAKENQGIVRDIISTSDAGRGKNGDKTFKVFLSALQIMQLSGKFNLAFFADLCETIKIGCYFLIDKDSDDKMEPKRRDFPPEERRTQIFQWETGSIEDVFSAMSKENDETVTDDELKIRPLYEKLIREPNKIGKFRKDKFFGDGTQMKDIESFVQRVMVISATKDSPFRQFVLFLHEKAME